jgi:ubiquinone/menaquinone biosynthesis C-methylase UbiE
MSKHQDLNQETYNTIALKYEDIYGQIPTAIALAKKLAEIMGPKKNAQILDLGCGSGSILKIFEDKLPSASLTGIDFAVELLKLAEKKLKRTNLKQMDLMSYDFNGRFDLIIATFSLIHLTDEELNEIATKIKTILNPDGYLYLSFILGDEEKIVSEVLEPSKQVYFNYHSESEILSLFSSKEFKTIESVIDEVKDEYETEQDLYLILQKRNSSN